MYWAGTQYIQYRDASVGPSCTPCSGQEIARQLFKINCLLHTIMWYSSWPFIDSDTTLRIEPRGIFSVLSVWKGGKRVLKLRDHKCFSPCVPNHSCSSSILKCNLTLVPYLFIIPERDGGKGSFRDSTTHTHTHTYTHRISSLHF